MIERPNRDSGYWAWISHPCSHGARYKMPPSMEDRRGSRPRAFRLLFTAELGSSQTLPKPRLLVDHDLVKPLKGAAGKRFSPGDTQRKREGRVGREAVVIATLAGLFAWRCRISLNPRAIRLN